MAAPRELKADEVDAFLARNPSVGARVIEFNALVFAFGWDQIRTEPGFLEFDMTIPGAIPPDGIAVQDSVFARVVIFPDASGNLHFTAFAPAGVGHDVGATGLPPLPDPSKIVSYLFLGGLALGGLAVVLELKPWRR